MGQIDLSKYNVRTDLIIENEKIVHNEEKIDNLTITRTKKNGNYFTLSFLDITNYEDREKVGKQLELLLKEILKLNNIQEDDTCLIVGLGNRRSTPDSLGVKVIDKTLVTSHLFTLGEISEGIRNVSLFSPGVMANTGIETAKIITSLVKEIKPDFVIAIDALAAR